MRTSAHKYGKHSSIFDRGRTAADGHEQTDTTCKTVYRRFESRPWDHFRRSKIGVVQRRRQIRGTILRMPGALKLPVAVSVEQERKEPLAILVRALVVGIRDGLDSQRRELRAIELVVDEVVEEFGGEGRFRADTRQVLDDAKAACLKLSDDIQPYLDRFELGEPSEEDVELVRRLVKSQADEG